MKKTEEVLICRYADTDTQRYPYKNVLQTYAANPHKRVPAGPFPHKLTVFFSHCITDCTALVFLAKLETKLQVV